MTSIGMNLQASGVQIYSAISMSGYAMHQTVGRLLRRSTKHKVIRTRYLTSAYSFEPALLKYVLNKRMEIVRTTKGDNHISREQLSDLIEMIKYIPAA